MALKSTDHIGDGTRSNADGDDKKEKDPRR